MDLESITLDWIKSYTDSIMINVSDLPKSEPKKVKHIEITYEETK